MERWWQSTMASTLVTELRHSAHIHDLAAKGGHMHSLLTRAADRLEAFEEAGGLLVAREASPKDFDIALHRIHKLLNEEPKTDG